MVGHVLTRESGSRYTLQRVGTLRVDGLWHEATARAGDTSWQFAGSGTVLSDGELTLAEVGESMGRVHEPVVIAVDDAAVVEPGLRLFLAFLVGWLHWCADDRANGD